MGGELSRVSWYGRVVTRITPAAPLILGSASPRRREILESLGIAHVVVSADIDESPRAGESADLYLERIALAKLDAVCERLLKGADTGASLGSRGGAARSAWVAVLVADTSVILEGALLGKPADESEAYAMILRLAGRTHTVKTRFAIAARATRSAEVAHAETVATSVTFRPLTGAEARAYAASREGLDKAGAYAVQGLGAAIVSRIDGSYSNVVGLPACEVVVALGKLGLV